MKQITKKPENIRTHSRYAMKERFYKSYVKCQCGTPIILNSVDWTECPTCHNKFKQQYNMLCPSGQQFVSWPTPLKKFLSPGQSFPAEQELMSSVFNLGRYTKKLLAEIKSLGGDVRPTYKMCIDGYKRIESVWIEYHQPKVTLQCVIYFEIYPENRNNKILNLRVKGFLDDLNELKASNKFKAPNAFSENKIVLETAMEYNY